MSISIATIMLNIFIQILLKYYLLKDEYWAPEARAIEKCYMKEADALEKEEESEVNFTDVIELWTAVGLYVNAGYKSVPDLPETQLRYIFAINQNLFSCSLS